jgi:hypothetical protein
MRRANNIYLYIYSLGSYSNETKWTYILQTWYIDTGILSQCWPVIQMTSNDLNDWLRVIWVILVSNDK